MQALTKHIKITAILAFDRFARQPGVLDDISDGAVFAIEFIDLTQTSVCFGATRSMDGHTHTVTAKPQ